MLKSIFQNAKFFILQNKYLRIFEDSFGAKILRDDYALIWMSFHPTVYNNINDEKYYKHLQYFIVMKKYLNTFKEYFTLYALISSFLSVVSDAFGELWLMHKKSFLKYKWDKFYFFKQNQHFLVLIGTLDYYLIYDEKLH